LLGACERRYDSMYRWLEERDKAMLYVLLDTGVHRRELINLTLGDITFDKDDPHILVHGKGRKDREIGLGVAARNERFRYRAQLLQRIVLRRQRKWLRYISSALLDLISGYGYKPLRSLYAYLITISTFALLFWCVTNGVPLTFGWFTQVITWLGMSPPPPTTQHLQGYEAVVVSMTSFHGRGFFQPVQSPGDRVAILAAVEAFFGLLLEIVLIATFTQRFFAR
jgi:hypothetical protein